MLFLHRVMKFRAAVDAHHETFLEVAEAMGELLKEFDDHSPQEQEEAEILLRRSKKDRRSEKNQVVTMTPLNGAPAVPESWMKPNRMGGRKSKVADKVREWVWSVAQEYEPLSKKQFSELSVALGLREKGDSKTRSCLDSVLRTAVKYGQLKLVRGKYHLVEEK